MTSSKFPERLRELKDCSGKTQVRIADDLGITQQAFSYYMNGREPDYDILIKIATYFHVTIDYLLGQTDSDAFHTKLGTAGDFLYPRGVDSARVILVVETKSARGAGTPEQPSRVVSEYWSLEGIKLAEHDSIRDAGWERSTYEHPESNSQSNGN